MKPLDFKKFGIAMSFSSLLCGTAIANGLPDTSLRADLQRVAAMRIYFGHQSVGGNILDGVKQLSADTDIPVQVVESRDAQGVSPGTLGHVRVGTNGNPEGKLASFERAIGPAPTNLDVALVKFCYVDFSESTDVKALFSSYVRTVERIQQRNPRLTVIHTTVPLTVVQAGPKAFLNACLVGLPTASWKICGAKNTTHCCEVNTRGESLFLTWHALNPLTRTEPVRSQIGIPCASLNCPMPTQKMVAT